MTSSTILLLEALARRPALVGALSLYTCFYVAAGRAITRPAPFGPRWLAALVARLLTWVMRVVARCPLTFALPDETIPPGKQHVVVWHPHGSYTAMCFMHCAQFTVQASPLTWYPGVAPLLFRLPLFRELLLLVNARSVAARSLEGLCAAGLSVGVQPGGIPEQLVADHTRELAVFSRRLGFVRLAMRHGMPLLPVYIFGESQAYTTLGDGGRALSAWCFKWLGAPLVPVLGRFALPWLVPVPTSVHVRWGNPVLTGPRNENPTLEQVEAVFEAYLAELRRVFDAHKDACLPPEVAARGLAVRFTGKPAAGPRQPEAPQANL